jgi:hypothetical protein
MFINYEVKIVHYTLLCKSLVKENQWFVKHIFN